MVERGIFYEWVLALLHNDRAGFAASVVAQQFVAQSLANTNNTARIETKENIASELSRVAAH